LRSGYVSTNFGQKDAPPQVSAHEWKESNYMSINLRVSVAVALFVVMAIGATIASAETPSPPGAAVYFINLKDGDTVAGPFKVQFGLTGMGIAPAGSQNPNTGHHHLLIDTQISPEQLKQPIPVDAQHRHFGGGQTEVVLTLPPGQHTLQLVLGDGAHTPHEPPVVSPVIKVTVK
jgi:hypothetical protein